MLDQLKELLGEELSGKVTEKLGEVELAIMNNGSVVKADKYDNLKADYQGLETKYETDISGVNSKLEAAITNAADYDGLKGTLATLQAENLKVADEHRKELLNVKKNSAIETALLKANVKDSYLDMVKSQLNIDSLQFEGDNLIGLTDKVQTAIEKFPDLFGEVKKVGVTPENHLNVPVGKKAQLIKEYNQAEINRDAKAMARLASQIKAIKE